MENQHSDSVDTKYDTRGNFRQDFFSDDGQSFEIEVVAASHVGKVRSRNEDHYAVFRRSRHCEMIMSNLPTEDAAFVENHAYGLIVADGIGGAEFGDFASQLAIETLLQSAGLATSWVMKFKGMEAQLIRERASAYVDRIQDAFELYSQDMPGSRQMGTTLTVAYLLPPHVLIGHIGDSRAYLFRDSHLHQLTRDQTLAQSLVDSGASQDQVRNLGNVLLNSLGSGREHVEADVLHVDVQFGDRLLLCTDGLSDMVDDQTIAESMQEPSLQDAGDLLLDLALKAGGKDNITLVICGLKESGDSMVDTVEYRQDDHAG
jgi:serine/threonine protein phosphatase PrpC